MTVLNNRRAWFYVIIFRLGATFSSGRKQVRNAGFGLLDTAISLAITGILVIAVLKGYNLVEQARLMGVTAQAEQLLMALHMSDEPLLCSGESSAEKAWESLVKQGLISTSFRNGYPVSKVGGIFDISSTITNHPGTWLVLTAKENALEGVLTPAQAEAIDQKKDTGDPTTGAIRAIDGSSSSGKCLSSGRYNLKESGPVCVLLFRIL